MKTPLISLCSLALLVATGCAEPTPSTPLEGAPTGYVNEAKLPQGWPAPGPFGEVVEKTYPAYRAAFTEGGRSGSSFWKLFRHIKSRDIPMTAPVEMTMEEEEEGMEMTSMAFLYQNPTVGEAGADGETVEVKDVPAARVLSYAWQGARSDEALEKAKEALKTELTRLELKSSGFRLLGYNGPSVPKKQRTHELQALLVE
ncbi:MAG: heme-binding protein [Verrucomicrobiota bacterium JB023]|nr:heme-binding protein [Verrucomicrobiota bacterium JB023]